MIKVNLEPNAITVDVQSANLSSTLNKMSLAAIKHSLETNKTKDDDIDSEKSHEFIRDFSHALHKTMTENGNVKAGSASFRVPAKSAIRGLKLLTMTADIGKDHFKNNSKDQADAEGIETMDKLKSELERNISEYENS